MVYREDNSNLARNCEACCWSQTELVENNNLNYQHVGKKAQNGRVIFVKNGFEIVRCPNCGLVSTNIPFDFDPNQIYTKAYFQGDMPDGYYDYLGSEQLLTHENLDRLSLVRSYKPEGILFEVGCASGAFLAQAQNHFFVQGIDVSAFAIEAARQKGLDVECASLEKSRIITPPYDVVVLFDTIEHLPSPKNTLNQIYSILGEDGYLFITTGDFRSLLARLTGKYWRLMTPPQHLWFFDNHTISILLQELGFELVSIRYMWRKVPLSLVWYQLFRGKMKPLPSRLTEFVIPLNLFDTMTVVARK